MIREVYMSTYTLTTILTILTMINMIFVARSNNILMPEKRRGFYAIFAMIAISAAAEWTGVFADNGAQSMASVHVAAKFLEFSIAPFIAVVTASVLNSKEAAKPLVPIIVLHTILEFTSIFNGCVFDITSANVYTHGPAYYIYYAVVALCTLYTFWIFSKVSRRYQNRNASLIWFITLFMIISCLTHILFEDVRIQWLGTAISSIFIYTYYTGLIQQVDSLTNMLNRACYDALIASLKKPVKIFIFDVDHFKEINDTYGHHYGDVCLQTVARCIIETYHSFGHCYRTGGDEFCAVLDRAGAFHHDVVDPKKLNSELVNRLSALRERDHNIPTVSIGYTDFDPSSETILDAVSRADSIMYHYKNMRRGAAPEKKVIRAGAYMSSDTTSEAK